MRMTVRNVRSHTHTASLTRMGLGNASRQVLQRLRQTRQRTFRGGAPLLHWAHRLEINVRSSNVSPCI
jgi:hypothetical protein